LCAADSARGAVLFSTLSCIRCHGVNGKGGTLAPEKNALTPRLKSRTLTDIAVTMWNHEPKMPAAPAPLQPGEMREIVSYLWAGQFFEDAGSPAAGARVFTARRCAACHSDSTGGAPKLTEMRRSFSAAAMVSALWHHGSGMLDQMKAKGIAWPRFDGSEMANIIAYLNAQNGGK
jgi:mono/diheme cytochrome c family protein